MLDTVDIKIINELQGGFPICSRPYAAAAEQLGIEEADLLARVQRLTEGGQLSRFGPLFNAERLGGAYCLCAASVPADVFDEVVDKINAHPEVAHNYERNHPLNVWFVLGTEQPERIEELRAEIEEETGCEIHAFPKLQEFFIGLKVEL